MKQMLIFLLLISLLLCGCGGQAQTETPESTGLPANIMQKEDPKGDEEMNILFIGDSSCHYWTDELWGLLDAAGYENVNVCNVYYDGCTLKQYWTFHEENATKFEFRTANSGGRKSQKEFTLAGALQMYNWDVISFQNSKTSMYKGGDKAGALATTEPYLSNLYEYVHDQYPLSNYYWHQNWSCEVGYDNSVYQMTSVDMRTEEYEKQKYVAEEVAKKYGFKIIPTGDAWEKVRDLPLFRTPIEGVNLEEFTLCSRIHNNKFMDDLGHDGDIGGGQYLNACVAFEVITGQSCVGNTFCPKYELSGIDCSLTAEKIGILQNAAHEAVAALSK